MSFGRYLYENVDGARMRHALMEAGEMLLEALNPNQKARKAIRDLLPEPPGGWDSPAVGTDGEPLLTTSGNGMSKINCLEYDIRNKFFHDSRSNPKFEAGIARIAYGELGNWPEGLEDWRGGSSPADTRSLGKLARILREISGVHSDDYDYDLNGMTYDELYARFATGSSGERAVNEEADGSGTDYRVVWIPDFPTAKKYARYTEDVQQWCLTQEKSYWSRYTKGNTVKMYFLMSPDIDTVKPEAGPDAPLDAYGLSLLGVGIAPDGSLDCCCTRWNHRHGGSDMAMDEAQLCRLLNVRELSDICPPFTEEDRERQKEALRTASARLLNGEGKVLHRLRGLTVVGPADGNGQAYVFNDHGLAFPYPVVPDSVEVYGDYSMVVEYEPSVSEEDDGEEREYGDGPRAIIRHDGAYNEFPEFDSDTDIADMVEGDGDGLFHGRIILLHAPWEDSALFDVSTMEYMADDCSPDYLGGNMFTFDYRVFLVTEDGCEEIIPDGVENTYSLGSGKAAVLEEDESTDNYVLAIHDSVTGEKITSYENVDRVREDSIDNTLEVTFDDGEMTVLDRRTGKPYFEKTRMSKTAVGIGKTGVDGKPYTYVNVLADGRALIPTGDKETPARLARLPVRDLDQYSRVIIIGTQAGPAIFAVKGGWEETPVTFFPGMEPTGDYSYGSMKGGVVMLFDGPGDHKVNLLNPVTGKPAFEPEFEKILKSTPSELSLVPAREVPKGLDGLSGEPVAMLSVEPEQMPGTVIVMGLGMESGKTAYGKCSNSDDLRNFIRYHSIS